MGKSKKESKNTEKKKKHKKKEHKHKKLKTSKREKKTDDVSFAIPVELMNNKSHAPETPEEYQRRSTALRREVDPVTGRTRLIRGSGEILEEIVSKERHNKINKEATESDGRYFQEKTVTKGVSK